MITKLIGGLGSMNSGPGALLRLAANYGVLPESMAIMVKGLEKAPIPQLTQLDGDWFKNIDTISHSLGCVVCGVFDSLVEGLSREEILTVKADGLKELLPDNALLRTLVEESFDICKELYLKYGDLTDAVDAKKFKPEGLITKAALSPMIRKGKGKQNSDLGRNLLLGSRAKSVEIEKETLSI